MSKEHNNLRASRVSAKSSLPVDASYELMNELRNNLFLNMYTNDSFGQGRTLSVVLSYRTSDGKLHQLTNGVVNL